MQLNPRPYQEEQIRLLRQGFNRHLRQILCSPTGSGKTVVMSYILKLAIDKGTRCWVLTDRIELCDQTLSKVNAVVHSQVQLIRPGCARLRDLPITICMVETLNRRLGSGKVDIPDPDLIIIDECHKRNFNKVIDKFPNTPVVGLTATPIGKDLYNYYHDIVHNIDIPDLIEQGYLARCKAFQMQDDMSDVRSAGDDFRKDDMFKHFNKSELYDGVVEKYNKVTPNKKAIVFNVNVAHAKKMTEKFREAGHISEYVSGNTPKQERVRIFKAFEEGYITVLNNCDVATTGVDIPSIEVIVLNRSIKSLALFLQCCGRGGRIIPGEKELFYILDFGMNHDRLGRWDFPRTWQLSPPKKKGKQAAPIKACPKCDAVIAASARYCDHCGYAFPKNEKGLREGDLKEVPPHVPEDLTGKKISSLTIDQLIRLQKAKQFKASLIWRVVRTEGPDALKNYAKKIGYSQGWVRYQMKEMKEGKVGYNDYLLNPKRRVDQ